MNNEKSKKPMKRGYHIHPMSVKVEAVEQFEKGLLPSHVILEKYDISRITLHNWRRQIRRGSDGPTMRPKRSDELKLRIVKGVVTKAFTIQKASELYNVSPRAIQKWCSKYSYQLAEVNEDAVAKKQKENSADKERIRQLERALEDANLRIIGLETVINIAEQDLKIDIRKKSGTKQSK